MKQTKGVREGRIIKVTWPGPVTEFYSSLAALYGRRTAEEVGISYNSLRCYMSRKNGLHETRKCVVEYVTLWIAERGPRKKQ